MPKKWDELEEKVVVKPRQLPLTLAQINTTINKLCIRRCGKIPTHITECKGYNANPLLCLVCIGSGKGKPSTTLYNIKEPLCSKCLGTGRQPKYTCRIRLLSDNINFARGIGSINLVVHYYKELLREVEIDAKNTASSA